jgi:hypothetical protein
MHLTPKAGAVYSFYIGISENISFKATNISSFNFPLKLSAVEQKDSKSSFAIQLADLLVGGVVEHCMALKWYQALYDIFKHFLY